MTRNERDEIILNKEDLSRTALLDQMERVLESKHFRNSKRYPMLLRFVVEQTLDGGAESLKERILGMEVFARPGNYDTNADPIVRVTAGEVRKRLAQYYQEPGHEHEVRIDLPLGGYVPHFFRPGAPAPADDVVAENAPGAIPGHERPEDPQQPAMREVVRPIAIVQTPQPASHPAEQTRPGRSVAAYSWTVAACLAVAALLIGGLYVRQRRMEPGIAALWQVPLSSSNPFTIVIGVHSLDNDGREREITNHAQDVPRNPADMLDSMVRLDMVPVSDVVSYSRVTDLLTRKNHPYTTLGSSSATIAQIRSGPVVLIGGLDNVWTLRLTSGLRYRFAAKDPSANSIIDSQQPSTVWRFDNLQTAAATTQDYAIVASYFDSTLEQPVLVVAGIGMAGTEVAGEFMTSETGLRNWLAEARPRNGQNVEIVLSTEVVDGKAGPPRVIASAVW